MMSLEVMYVKQIYFSPHSFVYVLSSFKILSQMLGRPCLLAYINLCIRLQMRAFKGSLSLLCSTFILDNFDYRAFESNGCVTVVKLGLE